MAIVASNLYAGRVITGDSGYPLGKAQDIVNGEKGTGTPLRASWVNDQWGFMQALLDAANITPSGTPDQVGQSDYLDAVNKLIRGPLALKIFQSPSSEGLTEIQTRTVDVNEVYEVRKTSDDSLATIYSDAAGTTEIGQNGTDNKSGSDGVVEFYIADGDYYVEVGGVKSNFNTTSRDKRLDSVEDLKAAFGLLAGDTISTKGYYSPLDGGATTYDINTDSEVDGYSSFAVIGGLYAHPYRKQNGLTSTQFGIMPDGVTNWEADDGLRMQALYAALNKGVEVRFIRVGENSLYFTGMNIYNYYAQKWTMAFDEGVEFGNILHIISSGTAIFDREVSTPTGTNPTITFSESHGMATRRYCSFKDTGTSLDSGSHLVTPIDATTATVEAVVTGSNTGVGTVSDTPIKNVTLKGTYTTYDRWGLINVNGLKADRIVCKSDPSKHTTGQEGGGVHIFTMCKNFDVGEVIVEDTKNQAASANMHAAYAQDGVGLENINVGRIWVKDTKVNGAIIAGKSCSYGTIQIDAYGNGVMSSSIPFSGVEDVHGRQSKDYAHGVWLSRLSGTISNIVVDNVKGFSGRGFAQHDVVFDRDFITWDSPNLNSLTDTKEGLKVGHIQCLNPHYVGVSIGTYKQWSCPEISKITFGIIPDDNDAVISDSLRLERGLVNIGYARPKIGQIKATDIKECTLLLNHPLYRPAATPAMGREAYVSCNSIDVDKYVARVVDLYCPNNLGSINITGVSIKGTYYLEPAVSIASVVKGSKIGSIYSSLPSPINKSLLNYGAQAGQIGMIYANNYVANSSTNGAVVHFNSCKYSTANAVVVEADSSANSAAGVKYTGCYNVMVNNAKVENMDIGVKDGGGNGRLGATMCVSVGNTTATDLPTSVLVADIGNFGWSV